VPSIPGYIYASSADGIFVNLYVAGSGKAPLGGLAKTVNVTQQTRYPWDGSVKLTIDPQEPATFDVNLRIPAWCEGAKLAVAGKPVEKLDLHNGYARVRREWKPGDLIELDLPMKIQRMEAHPAIKADVGRVAIQRGPVVYCFETVDNGGPVRNLILARDPKFTTEHRPDLLGGVTVIKGIARDGRQILAVPYYAWDHRKPGEMVVWVRQDGKSKAPPADDPAWQGKLYRPLNPGALGPSEPPTLADQITATASHCDSFGGTVTALCDQVEPRNSCDHNIPRFTWYDHCGTKEWVQYDFDSPQKVSAVAVYWFDDEPVKRHCRAPKSWKLLYKEGSTWRPVSGASAFGTAINKYNRVTFTPVETTALRIEAELNPPWSGGILEWKVE